MHTRDPATIRKLLPARVLRLAPADPQPVAGSRVVRFVYSDETVDRAGDVVRAAGWQLGSYLRNPVALFGHDADKPEHIIGRSLNLGVDGKRLVGEIEFMSKDLNPTADMLYRMYQAGYVKAVSVGFRPLQWEIAKDRDDGTCILPPLNFIRQELMEISVVAVPANPNAVALPDLAVVQQGGNAEVRRAREDRKRRARMIGIA